MEYTYSDIKWEFKATTGETDIDGAGARGVELEGFAYPDEGSRFGHFEFVAFAQEPYPYDGNWQNIEIEETKFIPNEGD